MYLDSNTAKNDRDLSTLVAPRITEYEYQQLARVFIITLRTLYIFSTKITFNKLTRLIHKRALSFGGR